VLDHLGIAKVAVVGWSDGAITGLDMAMNYSSRVERVFAHGANIQANMSIPGLDDPIINSASGSLGSDIATNGTTYSINSGPGVLKKRDAPNPYAYSLVSPTPEKEQAMEDGVNYMWATEPTWGPDAMEKINCPVWVVDGDHE
jgi:pimeloyl-ACP methyl ester carboxylesterase